MTEGGFGKTLPTTLGPVRDIKSLLDDVISAGPGGTVTQGMVDKANEIKPAVDKANG
ncbi:hypothetical protein [Streptomyces sp. NPDC020607]|uniref:hypothetical protein n=1 Tax=Streptomyces sp. NPDC020607 TaxID=3365082 RepID=UPI003790931C